jgi:hypothetical protein
VFPVHFAACTERSLEQIKSGLWPTHLFRQITGAVTAHSHDGTKSSANLIIQRFLGEFNRVGGVPRPVSGQLPKSSISRYLRIRGAFREEGIQASVVTIDVIEKVHGTVFLCDGGYVEKKDGHLRRQVNLPIIFA